MFHIEQLVSQAKSSFQAKDYETCMAVASAALIEDASNAEAAWLKKEAQRQWEDQRSQEEFEIYVENLKKEARDLFDQEHYEQCVGIFKFLVELEPENHTLRDYLKLSQQMFLETITRRNSQPEFGNVCSLVHEKFRGCENSLPSSPSDANPRTNQTNREADFRQSLEPIQRNSLAASAGTSLELIPYADNRTITQDHSVSADTRQSQRRVARGICSAAGLAGLLVACFWLYSLLGSSTLEIQSVPDEAKVFIDGQPQGQTPFAQQKIPPGDHVLRIERQGFIPLNRTLVLKHSQAAFVFVQLEQSQARANTTGAAITSVAPDSQSTAAVVAPESPPSGEATLKEPARQVALSVIHHHVLGSCTGRLKIENNLISFRPSGNSNDGFLRRITQIENAELADKLTIQFKDKTYRFEALARNQAENRQKLATLHQEIRTLLARPSKG
jgi:PEGA domain